MSLKPRLNVKWKEEWKDAKDGNGDTIGLWIRKEEGDGCRANCKWCAKPFIIKSGMTNILSHANSECHKSLSRAQKLTKPITAVFTKTSPSTTTSKSSAKAAELRWVFRIIEKNWSFESQEDIITDFKGMFTDSKIPNEMKLSPKKVKYLATDAIGPFMQGIVLKEIQNAGCYSIHVDEANKLKSYVALCVRFLRPDTWDLVNVCIDLTTVTGADAATLSKAINDTIGRLQLDRKKCLSVMSDSCNVMRGIQSCLNVLEAGPLAGPFLFFVNYSYYLFMSLRMQNGGCSETEGEQYDQHY